MGLGSNQAVQDGDEAYRDDRARQVARHAAELVAAGDMGRDKAVQVVAQWRLAAEEAEGDVTGVIEAENVEPRASRPAPPAKVSAIAAELLDAAREALDGL